MQRVRRGVVSRLRVAPVADVSREAGDVPRARHAVARPKADSDCPYVSTINIEVTLAPA